jgi:PAS domain S-box-containing protein
MDRPVKTKKTESQGQKSAARESVRKASPKAGRGFWLAEEEFSVLQERLREAQETLDAIRCGEVDAVVVSGAHGNQIYSLTGAEQPYRVYVERMQEGAVTVTAEGLILYSNQRFADMLGTPLERVISSEIRTYLSSDSWQRMSEIIDSSDEAAKFEGQLQCANDATLPVHFTASSLPLPEQTVICLVVTDLTEQKVQEELRMAKEVAERASLAKDSFLAALSHELRTPLTPALMALIALEQDDTVPESAREDLSMIRRNIELETRLIDDLLDLTRIANGKLELHDTLIDLHGILSRAVEICRPNIDAKKQKLQLALKASTCRTMGDSVRLQQVFWNLIRNAVKFTPSGGTITIRTENPGRDGIRIEVADTGIGFEAGLAPRLFQAFEQSGRDITRQFGGLGLGLAISRSIVEAHGGTVQAMSDGVNRGATFSVELPLRKSREQDANSPRSPKKGVSRKCRILVVEDHGDTRASMQRMLQRDGHKVLAASSAREALEAAEMEKFDLVISDLGLPDMNGNEMMAQLHRSFGIPGIAVSGYGMEEDIARSRDAGFQHHLTKPIRIDRLKELIAQITGI